LFVAVALGAAMALSPGDGAAQAARQIPPKPTYEQLVPGLLARTRFVAPATADRRVELWDLLVGPGQRSAAATLPGGAVLEVRGGSGRISIGEREQELRAGATLAVADGASFRLVNARNDLGLSIRATVIIAGRR
jgi:mannose-6-phosphate isomerase-like protein (cupin superfamily)